MHVSRNKHCVITEVGDYCSITLLKLNLVAKCGTVIGIMSDQKFHRI